MEADALVKLASIPSSELARTIPVEFLVASSVDAPAEQVMSVTVEEGPT